MGIGERTLDVPEKLRFQQVGGDGRTVESHEGLVPARRVLVNRPGNQLFAGAALPHNQDSSLELRHLLDERVDSPHLLTTAHDLAEHLLLLQLLLEGIDSPAQGLPLLQLTDGKQDFVRLERLGNVVVGPLLHGLHRGVHGPVGRHDDNGAVDPPRIQLVQKVQAAHLRHQDVGEHQIELVLLQSGQGFLPRSRRLDLQAGRLEL